MFSPSHSILNQDEQLEKCISNACNHNGNTKSETRNSTQRRINLQFLIEFVGLYDEIDLALHIMLCKEFIIL